MMSQTPRTFECPVNTPERAIATLALLVACDQIDMLPENFISPEDLANALRHYTAESGALSAESVRQGGSPRL